MIDGILGMIAISIVPLIVLAAYVSMFALIIICLIRLSRYLMTTGKEQKLMRMELGKLAEEVQAIRQKLDNYKEQNEAADSQQK